MQILLQKVVSAMLYGDPILARDSEAVGPGAFGNRAPKLNVELTRW